MQTINLEQKNGKKRKVTFNTSMENFNFLLEKMKVQGKKHLSDILNDYIESDKLYQEIYPNK